MERNVNRNVPREFGAPIRRPEREPRQPAESFEDFSQDLYKHEWSHTINNYRDYIKSVKAEDRLFARAMALGPNGVDAFRRMKEDAVRELINTAAYQAVRTERTKNDELFEQLKGGFMAIMSPEQKAAVEFMERLWTHDWFHDYIDETAKWRGHDDRHKALLKEAKAGGEAFEAMWLYVYLTKVGKDAKTEWTFAQHYANKFTAY